MDLSERFNQSGGSYYKRHEKNLIKQDGGSKHKLSPKDENWKKKYLLQKKECELLKRENSILKKKLNTQKKTQ